MTTLRVSGFPDNFTPDQVRRVFQPFGAVHAVRPSGEGASGVTSYDVDMVESEAAQAAQRLLEGLVFGVGDRPLHVVRADYSEAA